MSTYREMLPYVKKCVEKEYPITLEEAANGSTEQRREYLEGACVRLLRSCYDYNGDMPLLHYHTEYTRLICGAYDAFRLHDFAAIIEQGENPIELGLDLPHDVYSIVDDFWLDFIFIFGPNKLIPREMLGLQDPQV